MLSFCLSLKQSYKLNLKPSALTYEYLLFTEKGELPWRWNLSHIGNFTCDQSENSKGYLNRNLHSSMCSDDYAYSSWDHGIISVSSPPLADQLCKRVGHFWRISENNLLYTDPHVRFARRKKGVPCSVTRNIKTDICLSLQGQGHVAPPRCLQHQILADFHWSKWEYSGLHRGVRACPVLPECVTGSFQEEACGQREEI